MEDGEGFEEGGDITYSPTAKHQPGGWGTEMDLDNLTAKDVLNNSIPSGKQLYGIKDGKLYEFQPDNVGGYHGYPIKGTETPVNVLRQFLKEERITNVQYMKLIKGK